MLLLRAQNVDILVRAARDHYFYWKSQTTLLGPLERNFRHQYRTQLNSFYLVSRKQNIISLLLNLHAAALFKLQYCDIVRLVKSSRNCAVSEFRLERNNPVCLLAYQLTRRIANITNCALSVNATKSNYSPPYIHSHILVI